MAQRPASHSPLEERWEFPALASTWSLPRCLSTTNPGATDLIQVSYLEKTRQVGFSIEVNDRPKVACSERRGAGMQISCYTGGLLYLEQGDKVSLKDSSPASKVDSGLGRTFMGIVKLTGDWI